MKLFVSHLITRSDHGIEGEQKIQDTNGVIKISGVPYINNENITKHHLNGSKLHLHLGARCYLLNIL